MISPLVRLPASVGAYFCTAFGRLCKFWYRLEGMYEVRIVYHRLG